MAFTEIPTAPPSQQGSSGDVFQNMTEFDVHETPVVLLELQDELARSRLREALWLSLIVHLFVVIALSTSPKWAYGRGAVIVMNPRLNQHETTYLTLPPDEQKLTERPKTDIVSDKDRIATSRNPSINHRELKRILDYAKPGAPTPPAPAQPQQQQMAQAQQPQNPAQQSSGPQMPAQTPPVQQPKLETLRPGGGSASNNPFSTAMSAGSAIDQAARATANSRGAGTGSNGEYGIPQRSNANVKSDLEILSDTQGVDFSSYLERVKHAIRMNWYNLIPEAARSPLRRKGVVVVQFAIQQDGRVAGMRLMQQSGDISLDRAAWGGITASNPFPQLPTEFHGNYIALRCSFLYNMDLKDLE
jgi:TonB family protein